MPAGTCPICGGFIYIGGVHDCRDTPMEKFMAEARPPRLLPQVDVSGLSNDEIAAVPLINRLHGPMTEAERQWFDKMDKIMRGEAEYDLTEEDAALEEEHRRGTELLQKRQQEDL